jgi:C_GCAxxG_C_C family probable redox protein
VSKYRFLDKSIEGFFMFRTKQKKEETIMENRAEKVAAEAEGLYRSGKMHCAEAVLAAVMRDFMPEAGEEMVRLAAGFGGGSGAGCICGAVVGGSMAFGLLFAADPTRVKRLTKELHRWFQEEYGATCCKIILKTHKKICYELTGKVAGKVAEMVQS